MSVNRQTKAMAKETLHYAATMAVVGVVFGIATLATLWFGAELIEYITCS